MTKLPYKLECKRDDEVWADVIAAFDIAVAATAYMEECKAANPTFGYRVVKGRKVVKELP